jgi:hypothetical protein
MSNVTPQKTTLLSVNINEETADALLTIAEQKNISVTEAVARAINLAAFLDKEMSSGRRLFVMNKNGRKGKELFFR